MKKILFLMALAASLFTVQSVSAQRNTINIKAALSSTYSKVLDTVTSTAAHYMVTTQVPASVGVTMIATFTNLTGTVGGTATIEHSLDGTTGWSTVYLPNTDAAIHTYTLSDTGSQSTQWDVSGWLGGYYRVKVVGSGATHSYTVGVKYTAYARQ